jgi:hypothetical protein
VERGCKEELQTCSMDESCQSGSLHEIFIRILSGPNLGGRSKISKFDAGGPIIELQKCFIACPEFWCTINELGESWAVKIDLIEESYIHVVELRGVDAGHEFL